MLSGLSPVTFIRAAPLCVCVGVCPVQDFAGTCWVSRCGSESRSRHEECVKLLCSAGCKSEATDASVSGALGSGAHNMLTMLSMCVSWSNHDFKGELRG